MNKTKIIIFLIIALFFAVGFCLYPQMPERMASHWDAKGQVDGYISKFLGLFLIPIISLVMALFFLLVPKIDPLKENIQKFRKYFDGFIILIILFLFYLYLLTIFWNFGVKFSMNQVLSPAFGILFFYCGILIGKTKRNWFIGIRTPWTLSSEAVWDKTHQLGSKLFKTVGGVAFLGILFSSCAIFLVIIPVILVSLYLTIYSYFEYRRDITSSNRF